MVSQYMGLNVIVVRITLAKFALLQVEKVLAKFCALSGNEFGPPSSAKHVIMDSFEMAQVAVVLNGDITCPTVGAAAGDSTVFLINMFSQSVNVCDLLVAYVACVVYVQVDLRHMLVFSLLWHILATY
jgi:hypothetical protein